MRKLIIILSAWYCLFFFASCEKEYSFENGGNPGSGSSSGTAVYTFDDGSGNCSTAEIFGNYTKGTALDSSNKVVFEVTVTTPGTYFLNTITRNGIVFSGQGSFSDTGSTSITLFGSGTPLDSGSYTYIPGNRGCKFYVQVNSGGGTGPVNYLKCSIDGMAKTFNDNLTALNSGDTAIIISGNETNAVTSPSLEISLLKRGGSISTGAYTPPSLTNLTNICVPIYEDGSPNLPWGGGITGQPNPFTVTVTNVTPTLIEGTFTGSIYDNSGAGTTSKPITNGLFSVTF